MLETTGGETWATLDRDDPLRATYLNAVALRTSLMSAYMAFKLADLVTGLGALFVALGLGGGVASGFALRQSQNRQSQRLASGITEEQRDRLSRGPFPQTDRAHGRRRR